MHRATLSMMMLLMFYFSTLFFVSLVEMENLRLRFVFEDEPRTFFYFGFIFSRFSNFVNILPHIRSPFVTWCQPATTWKFFSVSIRILARSLILGELKRSVLDGNLKFGVFKRRDSPTLSRSVASLDIPLLLLVYISHMLFHFSHLHSSTWENI